MNRKRILRDYIEMVSLLGLRRLLNLIKLRGSYYLSTLSGHTFHAGLPFALSVEPTTRCNLFCPECPVGAGLLKRPGGEMPLDFFKELIDQVPGTVFWLNLYFQGEPLLHPFLFEMIRYATDKKIYSVISTNGQLLSTEKVDKILSSELSRIIISLDGVTEETYKTYRHKGDFGKVIEGIRKLVEARERTQSKRPFIILQFILFAHNEHEVLLMKKLADELGVDQLVLKTAQIMDPDNARMKIPMNSMYSRYIMGEDSKLKVKGNPSGPCFRMWSSSVVTWDGQMVPCCYDKQAEYCFGDLRSTSFMETWRSSKATKFRSRILKNRTDIKICQNCNEK